VKPRNGDVIDALIARLEDQPVSRLSDHGAPCCATARAWYLAMARAAARSGGPEPRWTLECWRWGPVVWPLAWCQAIQRSDLDCGALAHLVAEAFRQDGRDVVRVQILRRESAERCEHWAARWAAVPGAPAWIWGGIVYHEEVGVVDGAAVRLWNPTQGAWHESSHGGATAFRLLRDEDSTTEMPVLLHWGPHALSVGRWVRLRATEGGEASGRPESTG
jgi:hypothetical protein